MAGSVERMTTLATQIAEKTKIITDYLTAKNLEAASFDVNGLAEFPIPSEDKVPFNARLELVALTQELHDIALTPKEGLRYLAWDVSLIKHHKSTPFSPTSYLTTPSPSTPSPSKPYGNSASPKQSPSKDP